MDSESYWIKRAEECEQEWIKNPKIRLKKSLPSITGGLFLVLLMILLFYTADMPKIII